MVYDNPFFAKTDLEATQTCQNFTYCLGVCGQQRQNIKDLALQMVGIVQGIRVVMVVWKGIKDERRKKDDRWDYYQFVSLIGKEIGFKGEKNWQ